MKIARVPLFALVVSITIALSTFSSKAAYDDWKQVDPAELALKAPAVEKDADAEALFWEVRIDDNPEGDLIFNHYIRIKVFTERGRESQSKIDIEFGKFNGRETKIQDIAARTIKPDGSIVELKKDDVFERTIVKASGAKVKAKSFAMPAVEAGCIIEYRWREVRVNRSANNIRLQFQRDIPVQRVDYVIKPMAYEGASFASYTLHGRASPFVKDKGGFYRTTMTNMPAVHEEARMPPEDQVKIWALVFYAPNTKLDAQKYWLDLGRHFYDGTKSLMKPSDDVKQTAATLTTDAKSPEEKLQKIYEFCRTKINNVSNDASGMTPDERKKLKDNKSPSDTLKRGMGTAADVDLLFAALATASGFDARIALAPDRGDIFFDNDIREIPNAYFLEPSNIAVNVEGKWKFFNPGFNYVPFGMLRWQEEGEQALVTDPKEPIWVDTPTSEPSKSLVKRRAKFKLTEDGVVEGDVQIEYTGHFAIERKEEIDDESDVQRETSLKDEIKDQMSAAEISNVKIENVTDNVKPLVYSYHVRFPAYAQRTGKRLFLQPAFFQFGKGPMFVNDSRRYPIYFHYPWAEDDQVEYDLPPGFALDNADAPAPFNGGPIAEYKPSIAITSDNRHLIYKRSFFFGGEGMVLFPVSSYNQLRAFFDQLNKRDNHTVALKQASTN
jgi:uncharacterized protein DUF3857/transglutaminase superfamily protein